MTGVARVQPGLPVPLQPQMTEAEARDATDRVLHDFGLLWNKVLDLYERGAHIALGYPTWGHYWEGEFAMSPARGEQLVRAGRVARELERAGLPLPRNDLTARALAPVLRSHPDKLPELWGRAVQQHGVPNARQVKAIVEPFRRTHGGRARASRDSITQAASTRRKRGALRRALDDAVGAAEAALASVDDALATGPETEMAAEWREMAKLCSQRMMELMRKLRNGEGSE